MPAVYVLTVHAENRRRRPYEYQYFYGSPGSALPVRRPTAHRGSARVSLTRAWLRSPLEFDFGSQCNIIAKCPQRRSHVRAVQAGAPRHFRRARHSSSMLPGYFFDCPARSCPLFTSSVVPRAHDVGTVCQRSRCMFFSGARRSEGRWARPPVRDLSRSRAPFVHRRIGRAQCSASACS